MANGVRGEGNGYGRWQNGSSCWEEASRSCILVRGQDSLLANKGNKLVKSPKGSPQHGREAGGGV